MTWRYVGNLRGPQGTTGPPGAPSTVPGPQGPPGPPGQDSTVPGPTGPAGERGPAGQDSTVPGPTGPAGATGPTGPAGPGVPTGGTAGQLLRKASATNYDTGWIAAPVGLPAGGANGTLLAKTAATDYSVGWQANPLPAGGTTGQLLRKRTNTDRDVEWAATPPDLTARVAALEALPRLRHLSGGITNAAATGDLTTAWRNFNILTGVVLTGSTQVTLVGVGQIYWTPANNNWADINYRLFAGATNGTEYQTKGGPGTGALFQQNPVTIIGRFTLAAGTYALGMAAHFSARHASVTLVRLEKAEMVALLET